MTGYKARTYRSGGWWAIEITDGLPDNMLGVTQAKRLDKVDEAARYVIADLLGIEADTIEVEMTVKMPVTINVALRELKAAHKEAAEAAIAEMTAWRSVAVMARNEGLTMRETGQLLGVSHQRVKQLIDSA